MDLRKYTLLLLVMLLIGGCQSDTKQPGIISGYQIEPGSEEYKKIQIKNEITERIHESLKEEGAKEEDFIFRSSKTLMNYKESNGDQIEVERWRFWNIPNYEWKVKLIKDKEGNFRYKFERYPAEGL